jgi:hypothetical protein
MYIKLMKRSTEKTKQQKQKSQGGSTVGQNTK